MNDSITQGLGKTTIIHTDPTCIGIAKVRLEAKVWSKRRKKLADRCVKQPAKAELDVWRSQLITAVPIIIICGSRL